MQARVLRTLQERAPFGARFHRTSPHRYYFYKLEINFYKIEQTVSSFFSIEPAQNAGRDPGG